MSRNSLNASVPDLFPEGTKKEIVFTPYHQIQTPCTKEIGMKLYRLMNHFMIQVLLNDNSMLTTEEDYGVNKQTEKDDRTLENAKSVQMKLIFLQSSSIGKLS